MSSIKKVAEKLCLGILNPKEVILINTKQRSRKYVIKLVCKEGNIFIRLKKDQAANLMSDLMEFDELTYCGEASEMKKDLVGE